MEERDWAQGKWVTNGTVPKEAGMMGSREQVLENIKQEKNSVFLTYANKIGLYFVCFLLL